MWALVEMNQRAYPKTQCHRTRIPVEQLEIYGGAAPMRVCVWVCSLASVALPHRCQTALLQLREGGVGQADCAVAGPCYTSVLVSMLNKEPPSCWTGPYSHYSPSPLSEHQR
jgi:hypothetical protein